MKPSLFDEWPDDCQAQFWNRYPRKIAKADAMKALAKVRAAGLVKFPDMLAAIDRYVAWLAQSSPNDWRPEPKHPATWLNKSCWEDELPQPRTSSGPRTFASIAIHGARR